MNSRPRQATPRPDPRLYLITPLVADPSGIASQLKAAIDAADIAAVLLRLAPTDERAKINCAKALAAVVQARDIAVLLNEDFELVARSGADGAHVNGAAVFAEASESLKPERIVGVGGLASRHDAMLVAERGADYVMFGEPDVQGDGPSVAAVVERVAWWAELFEVPCVGYARAIEDIPALVRAGADFVAVGAEVWGDKIADTIRQAQHHLKLRESAT